VAGVKAQGQIPKPWMKALKSYAKEKSTRPANIVRDAVGEFLTKRKLIEA